MNVNRNEQELVNDGIIELRNLLEMARSMATMIHQEERQQTLSFVTLIFEGMADDEGGPDGAWPRQETNSILVSLRAATTNNEEQAVIRKLVRFLADIVE